MTIKAWRNGLLACVAYSVVFLLCGCADYKEARYAKEQGNYEKAFTFFDELADFGHAPSQVELARMYLKGEGTEKSPEKAAEFLQKAAAQNNEKAYFELGRLYEKGEGVPKDAGRAAENYHKAQELGYDRAAQYLAALTAKKGQSIE